MPTSTMKGFSNNMGSFWDCCVCLLSQPALWRRGPEWVQEWPIQLWPDPFYLHRSSSLPPTPARLPSQEAISHKISLPMEQNTASFQIKFYK